METCANDGNVFRPFVGAGEFGFDGFRRVVLLFGTIALLGALSVLRLASGLRKEIPLRQLLPRNRCSYPSRRWWINESSNS